MELTLSEVQQVKFCGITSQGVFQLRELKRICKFIIKNCFVPGIPQTTRGRGII